MPKRKAAPAEFASILPDEEGTTVGDRILARAEKKAKIKEEAWVEKSVLIIVNALVAAAENGEKEAKLYCNDLGITAMKGYDGVEDVPLFDELKAKLLENNIYVSEESISPLRFSVE